MQSPDTPTPDQDARWDVSAALHSMDEAALDYLAIDDTQDPPAPPLSPGEARVLRTQLAS